MNTLEKNTGSAQEQDPVTETVNRPDAETTSANGEPLSDMDRLQKKYKQIDGKIYVIATSVQEDDENEKSYEFIFRKPGTPSYDRYVKMSGTSGTKALRTFVLDNICEEQRKGLEELLEEYPAMAISIGEKLLNMLGLSKDTTVKKL